MNKSKIALSLSLIFVAGAIAGGALVSQLPETENKPGEPRRRGGHERKSPEEFREQLFNDMKTRLSLEPGQVDKVRAVFQSGFDQVTAIQDRSVREVHDAIKRNHAAIAKELNPAQQAELEKMGREHEDFMKKRGRRGPPPGAGPGGPSGTGPDGSDGPKPASGAKTEQGGK